MTKVMFLEGLIVSIIVCSAPHTYLPTLPTDFDPQTAIMLNPLWAEDASTHRG